LVFDDGTRHGVFRRLGWSGDPKASVKRVRLLGRRKDFSFAEVYVFPDD